MGVPWTEERRAKFSATMAARRSGGGQGNREEKHNSACAGGY